VDFIVRQNGDEALCTEEQLGLATFADLLATQELMSLSSSFFSAFSMPLLSFQALQTGSAE